MTGSITESAAWQRLSKHAQRLASRHLRQLFAEDPHRVQRFSLDLPELHIDFSKQRIDQAVWDDLLNLAQEADVASWRDRMFAGEAINTSENRAVLHVALRRPANGGPFPSGAWDVQGEVQATLKRMAETAERIRYGEWLGYSGQAIRHVVNIGIGGSDLGPKMVTQALAALAHPTLSVDFVSNLDGAALAPLLARLDPRRTLFIVASKTFGTQETLANAGTAKRWLLEQAGEESAERALGQHFLAVTAAPERSAQFGVPAANTFPMWDWVGGRYSLWSAVGLAAMISAGPDAFRRLLDGAAAMDSHFCKAEFSTNLPVLMALVGIWNTDFLGADTLAVLPYQESLRHLPAYLQQLEMESNGKTVCRSGAPLSCQPNPIVWGDIGINGQHAFFQLLHQGGWLVPCDFIAAARSDFPLPGHHEGLLANCLAQSAALAFGRTRDEALTELKAAGRSEADIETLLPHKVFSGNQPSTTLLLPSLTPESLGALIALYEHKVFVQGIIWGINSFDQWGVELGKALASLVQPAILDPIRAAPLDASTRHLLDYVRQHGALSGRGQDSANR